MSFPRKRESREYLSGLYSKILYNFAYFKCFFWIPAFAGMTYSTFLEPCNNAGSTTRYDSETYTPNELPQPHFVLACGLLTLKYELPSSSIKSKTHSAMNFLEIGSITTIALFLVAI